MGRHVTGDSQVLTSQPLPAFLCIQHSITVEFVAQILSLGRRSLEPTRPDIVAVHDVEVLLEPGQVSALARMIFFQNSFGEYVLLLPLVDFRRARVQVMEQASVQPYQVDFTIDIFHLAEAEVLTRERILGYRVQIDCSL